MEQAKVHCVQCFKQLNFAPLTIYVKCAGCKTVNELIRVNGFMLARLNTAPVSIDKLKEELNPKEEVLDLLVKIGVEMYKLWRKR